MPVEFEPIPPDARQKLVALLEQAAALMFSYGDESFLWSSYDTGNNLGLFLQDSAWRLAMGDDGDLPELFGIFLPTSDWDDSAGSVELGNQILDALEEFWIRKEL